MRQLRDQGIDLMLCKVRANVLDKMEREFRAYYDDTQANRCGGVRS